MENTNSKEQFDFFAYIGRMKYIVRWGLMRNTNSENIQEHSLQVAILAHALAVIHNKLCGMCLRNFPRCGGNHYGRSADTGEIL